MSEKITPDCPARQTLFEHAVRLESVHTMDMFAADPGRFERFSFEFGGLFMDLSKNHLDKETLLSLIDLARTTSVEKWRERMFAGEQINGTEARPALHVALRNPDGPPFIVDGEDITTSVRHGLEQMAGMVEQLRNHQWMGATGKPITDVLHIGIGGSILGPAAAARALARPKNQPIRVHYVSNVDAEAIFPVLESLNPESTLITAVSKSFTTLETLTNAETAREWLLETLPADKIGRHLIGITAEPAVAVAFGIPEQNILTFWPWVGGRFSLWSTVGLPIALTIGMDAFHRLLRGAQQMDRHFCDAPLEQNLPVLLALIGIWNTDFQDTGAHAILPYDERLTGLPQHLQQLEMESTGKSANRWNEMTSWHTAPIVFGMPGNDAQHTFFQALHQGTRTISADFIGCIRQDHPHDNHHDRLMANLFSQTEALMRGRTEINGGSDIHRRCPGNRPSTTILLDAMEPETLGMLLALYEHKVFVQGTIWGVNSFDQWGVELGKELAQTILDQIEAAGSVTNHDGSTNGLLNRFIKSRKKTEN